MFVSIYLFLTHTPTHRERTRMKEEKVHYYCMVEYNVAVNRGCCYAPHTFSSACITGLDNRLHCKKKNNNNKNRRYTVIHTMQTQCLFFETCIWQRFRLINGAGCDHSPVWFQPAKQTEHLFTYSSLNPAEISTGVKDENTTRTGTSHLQ